MSQTTSRLTSGVSVRCSLSIVQATSQNVEKYSFVELIDFVWLCCELQLAMAFSDVWNLRIFIERFYN